MLQPFLNGTVAVKGGIKIPSHGHLFWKQNRIQQENKDTEMTACLSSVTSWAAYKAKLTCRCHNPLCYHLESTEFSKARKSNALFKTNCCTLEHTFFSLMCNSFMPSWTHSTKRWTLRSESVLLGILTTAEGATKQENGLSISYGANSVWIYEL